MKLRVISLIRDEIDIVGLFLRHLDALFDEVILLDHQSIDGTTEILRQAVAQRPGWQYFRVDIKQNIQKPMMNFFIQKFKVDKFDYLFFLDDDEFFWVKDRQALEDLLTSNRDEVGVYGFKWINCIPKDLNSTRPIENNTRLVISEEPGGWQKIVVDWNQVDTGDLWVEEGNHFGHHQNGELYHNQVIGKLLHIPIRSRRQLASKALLAQCSLLLRANRTPGTSFQFNRFVGKIARNRLADIDLLRSLYYYQTGDDPIPEGWEEDFLSQCTVQRFGKLGIAISDSLKLKVLKHLPTIEQKIANALSNANIIDPDDCTIVLNGETITLSSSPHLGTDKGN